MQSADPSRVSGPHNDLRSRAEQLRQRSRLLRERSVAVLLRRDASVHRLQIRRELLRSEQAGLRGARAQPVETGEVDDWMAGEVLEMITGGWGRTELGQVGIGPEMLRVLRLDGHPALADAGD